MRAIELNYGARMRQITMSRHHLLATSRTRSRGPRYVLAALLATLAIAPAVGCGSDDDDQERDAHTHDASHDAPDEDATPAPDADPGNDPDEDVTNDTDPSTDAEAPDADPEPDIPTGPTFTIEGMVHNNTQSREGTLSIYLFTDEEGSAGPAVTPIVDPEPSFSYPYSFTHVPEGAYFVAAFLDIGEPNTWDDPGPGDLFGITASMVGTPDDGDVARGINVEIR